MPAIRSESICLYAVTLALMLQTLIDPEATKGVPRWRRLVEMLFRPSGSEACPELFRQSGHDYELVLGEKAETRQSDIKMLQRVISQVERELNRTSKRLNLGASVKATLVVSKRMVCRWSITLADDSAAAVIAYNNSLHERGHAIFPSEVVANSDYVRTVMRSFGIACGRLTREICFN